MSSDADRQAFSPPGPDGPGANVFSNKSQMNEGFQHLSSLKSRTQVPGEVGSLARSHENVTILFMDIVGKAMLLSSN